MRTTPPYAVMCLIGGPGFMATGLISGIAWLVVRNRDAVACQGVGWELEDSVPAA